MLALAFAAPGAQAQKKTLPKPVLERTAPLEVAVQDDTVFLHRQMWDPEPALARVRALGASRIRVNVTWRSVLPPEQSNSPFPPFRPEWRWEPYDQLIDAAAAHGIRVQLTLTGPAPAFGSGMGKVGVHSPRPDRFAQFAAAAARHFRGRVDRYAIWNEPNYRGWLQPVSGAAQIYRGLYLSGYRAIKSVDRRALVLFGETSPYRIRGRAIAPLKFIRDVLCVSKDYKTRMCPALRIDAVAHHPYDFTVAPNKPRRNPDDVTMGSLERLTSALDLMQAIGAIRTPRKKQLLQVYLTEYGYFAIGRRKRPDSVRARWLKQAFDIAAKNPRVNQMLQYQLLPPEPDGNNTYWDTSILTGTGFPRAPYYALRAWSRKAAIRGQVALPSGSRVPLPPAPSR